MMDTLINIAGHGHIASLLEKTSQIPNKLESLHFHFQTLSGYVLMDHLIKITMQQTLYTR